MTTLANGRGEGSDDRARRSATTAATMMLEGQGKTKEEGCSLRAKYSVAPLWCGYAEARNNMH